MSKIQTLAEYQQLASRTCPDLGTPEKNLLHMNLGITTEVGEFLDVIKKNLAYGKPLDIVNLGEEISDMAWYISNKARLFYPKSWEQQEQENSYEDLRKEFSKLFISIYEQYEINTRVTILLNCVINPDYVLSEVEEDFNGVRDMVILNYIADLFELDFFQILTNNINKLKVRYPEKFTNEAALNRDLEAERVELEKGNSITK